MKTSAALLFSVPVLWILAMNVPVAGAGVPGFLMFLSYVTFAAGIYWGFSRGISVRRAVALSAISLALFYAAMVFAPGMLRPILAKPPLIELPRLDPFLGIAATVFLVLAVIEWIRAFRDAPGPSGKAVVL